MNLCELPTEIENLLVENLQSIVALQSEKKIEFGDYNGHLISQLNLKDGNGEDMGTINGLDISVI